MLRFSDGVSVNTVWPPVAYVLGPLAAISQDLNVDVWITRWFDTEDHCAQAHAYGLALDVTTGPPFGGRNADLFNYLRRISPPAWAVSHQAEHVHIEFDEQFARHRQAPSRLTVIGEPGS